MEYRIDIREDLKQVFKKATQTKELMDNDHLSAIVETYADAINNLLNLERMLDKFEKQGTVQTNARVGLTHTYMSFEDFVKEYKELKERSEA